MNSNAFENKWSPLCDLPLGPFSYFGAVFPIFISPSGSMSTCLINQCLKVINIQFNFLNVDLKCSCSVTFVTYYPTQNCIMSIFFNWFSL